MNSHKAKAKVLKYVAATPSVFGSVESWVDGRTFNCSWNRNSSERNVRAGRDSDEVIISLYYYPATVKINIQDRIELNNRIYDILYLHDDSSLDDENMLELKAL